MKNKYRLAAFSVTLSILLSSCFLSGCKIQSGAELLHPPKTTGSEAEIEQLIEDTAGGSYMLKYPGNGAYRSAIVMQDFDKDGKKEAIAFYRTKNAEPVTRMLIMSDTPKGWKISCKFETHYTEIDTLHFADYDYDGIDEILAGFVTDTAGINELFVFDYNTENDTAEAIELKRHYSSFTTGDYDSDGSSEIMLLTLSSADTKANATLIDYNNNHLYPQSSCIMDENVVRYEKITSSLISGKHTGVVVDGFLTEGSNTQVIVFNDEKTKLENCITTAERTHHICSQDIDGDGFIEIPNITSSPVAKGMDSASASPVITWSKYAEDIPGFFNYIYSFANFEYEYSLRLPSGTSTNTIAALSKDKRIMRLYRLKSNNKRGNLLLTIRVFDTGSDSIGYTILESSKQLDYCYKISDSSFISDETLKKSFTLFDESVQ